jgi:hypothetical protein
MKGNRDGSVAPAVHCPVLFSFFAGLGIFFIGIGYLWQVSLQAKSMKHSASE